MSRYKEMQVKVEAERDSVKEPAKKPGFMLPEGYTIGWGFKYDASSQGAGYVLRSPEGKELGLFVAAQGKSVEDAILAHLSKNVAEGTRKALITLVDGDGKEIGSWERGAEEGNQIAVLLAYLASRKGI